MRLENCNTSVEITRELIEMINKRCFIRKLALVDMQINDDSFKTLCQYVDYSEHLIELDISWAAIRPSSILKMLEILSRNKRI